MSKQPDTNIERTRRRVLDLGLVRLAINLVVLLGAYLGLQIALSLFRHRFPQLPHDWVVLGGSAILGILMLAIYAVLVRWVELRWPKEIAFAPGLWLCGIVLGVLLFCAVYAVLVAFGVAHWEGLSGKAAVLIPLATALSASFGEEIAFRGGLFRVLEDSFGTAAAIVVSAVAFGLLHLLSPHANAVSVAAIALESGVLLGLAYAATRNLWFPIGLHFGWNFTEGGIFGTAVSGRGYDGFLRVSLSGPDALTGGGFGPEASAVAVVISLVASLVLLFITVRQKCWVGARWRMRLGSGGHEWENRAGI